MVSRLSGELRACAFPLTSGAANFLTNFGDSLNRLAAFLSKGTSDKSRDYVCGFGDALLKIKSSLSLLSSPLHLLSPPHQVWTSVFDARGHKHLLGPAAAEHSQQAVLSNAEWISGSGNHPPPQPPRPEHVVLERPSLQ